MDTPLIPTDSRPLGWWLHAIGPALRDRMRATLEDAGVTRRQWRILTSLHARAKTVEELQAALPPRGRRAGAEDAAGPTPDPDRGDRMHPFSRGGHGRFGRRFGSFAREGAGADGRAAVGAGVAAEPHWGSAHSSSALAEILDGLAERGWAERDGEAWRLTPVGEAEHDRILAEVGAVRAAVREGVSDEDWATAMSVLARIAANLRR